MRAKTYRDERRYFKRTAELSGETAGAQLFRHMDVMNEKASALLTHVSIMIAVFSVVAGISYQRDGLTPYNLILFCEMAVYALIGLVCTFCIRATSPSSFPLDSSKNSVRGFIRVYRRRRQAYTFVWTGNLFLTGLLLLTIGGGALQLAFPPTAAAEPTRIVLDPDAPRIQVERAAALQERPGWPERRRMPAPPPLPELLRYVSPAQTTQVNPRVRVEAACRTVFDIASDGTTDNVRACCAMEDENNRLGQPVLERGIAAAVERWRYRPDYEAFVYQARGVTGLVWYADRRFDAAPSEIRRGFLPEPPAPEACVFSEEVLRGSEYDVSGWTPR